MGMLDKLFGSKPKASVKKYTPNPSESRTKRINLMTEHSLYIRLKSIAKANGLTVGDVCEQALIDYVNNEIGE